MPMAAIVSISVLFFLLVPHFACAAGFVQSRSSPSELFNAPVVGRQGRELWDVVVGRPAAGEGRGACRTMTLAFNARRGQALEICCGVYTERVLQGLDLVISKARKNGIRLILCLTNNNKDIGGRPQSVRWPTNLDAAAAAFYTNRVVSSNFKKHVKRVLTRINTITGVAYRDEPAIMGWKLIILQPYGGQVDHHFGKTLNEWFQDMASFVKSIDRNHLVGVGVEEFNRNPNMPQKTALIDDPRYQVGMDFIRNNPFIKEVDFITIHGYANVQMTSGEADSKPLYGGGQNLELFPDMHREIQHRFLLHHGKSPPASLVVVSHVKTVPPSKPSGCTKIPSHDKGHCPPT